jgi:hypothetical protein
VLTVVANTYRGMYLSTAGMRVHYNEHCYM